MIRSSEALRGSRDRPAGPPEMDLRGDGMTLDYVARIYGVSPERMEILYRELIPGPPR